MQSRGSLAFASIYYGSGSLGRAVVTLGLIGALYAAVTGSYKLRAFAWTHIVLTIAFQLVALLVVNFAVGYHGPSPLYFELMVWPIMIIFAGFIVVMALQTVAEILMLVFRRIGWRIGVTVQRGLFAAVPLFLIISNLPFFVGRQTSSCESAGFFPVRATAITDRLEQEIAIRAGSPFRGLVATFRGAQGKDSVDWFALHGSDGQLWQSIGNDLRLVGLWWFNIPTLFQYSPLISPPYYLLLTEFLARPADRQVRSVVVLTQPNERMLKLWGVRFIIADFNPGFGFTRVEMPVLRQLPVQLVELPNANLGDYSPTEIQPVNSFKEGLRAMRDPSFDGRRTLVTEHPLVGPFVPAEGATLHYQKSGFSVRATSTGRSVLVLPIQYSRCWSITGEGEPVLFRANMMQLGISFTGQLAGNLVFRLGPVFASTCRIEDIRDVERLDIRNARSH
jgi:hypothetical protein